MRGPAFWYAAPEAPGLRARALAPLAGLWARHMVRRAARSAAATAAVPLPLITVGAVTCEDPGTRTAMIALLQYLSARGQAPHVILRRRNAPSARPLAVDPARHGRAELGPDAADAALLIAAFAPVWVTRDLSCAADAALRAGADTVVTGAMMARPRAPALVSVVVVDAARGFGNGRCLPAGPLRVPLTAALSGADLVLAIGPPAAQHRFERRWAHALRIPRVRGQIAPLETGMDWRGTRFLAFCSGGASEDFFATLRGLGADLVRTQILDGRAPVSRALMQRLAAEARRHRAQLVTTEVDAVRLPAAFRQQVLTLPMRLVIENPGALDAAIEAAMEPGRSC